MSGDNAAIYRRIVAAANGGDLKTALNICKETLRSQPRSAELVGMAGKLCTDMGDPETAEAYFARYIRLKPKNADGYAGRGVARKDQGDYRRALQDLRRACRIAPDNAEYRLHLGDVQEITGDLDEACQSFEAALKINPDFAEAFRKLAGHKTFADDDPQVAHMERIAASDGIHPDIAVNLHFALAETRDKAGDTEQAFRHYRQGNAIKRQTLKGYDPNVVLHRIARTARIFNTDLFEKFEGTGDPDARPVFIIGMPRSGTSLVEQILASHPQVYGAGETRFVEQELANYIGRAQPDKNYPEFVPTLNAETLTAMGQGVLRHLSHYAGGAARITDKMPQNFIYAGLIKLMLPNARIVHCRRDPLDTCFSCFKKMFSDDVPFSFDLEELANYYKSYRALTDQWRDVLPGGMMEIEYERVVDDLEGEARSLIDYCGLDWDPACLAFHEAKRDVATASNLQVRKPIYKSAVAAWKPYEAYLGPLLALR